MAESPGAAVPGSPRNLRRRRSVRLTGRGWGAIVFVSGLTLAAGVLGRREFVAAAAAALVLVVAALVYAAVRRPVLRISRDFAPELAVAGDPVEVTVTLENRARSASPALEWNDVVPWIDEIPAGLTAGIPVGSVSKRRVRVRYAAHPRRRGLYAIGPFVAEYGDPFGMVRVVTAIGGTDPLLVVPEVTALPDSAPALADGDGVAQFSHRRALGTDDDLTTREYRPGDAMRRVHWKASARHGELMVRQEEQRSHPEVRVLVDTRLDGYPDAEADLGDTWRPAATSEAFEWVVRMTAALAVHLDADGYTVALHESAETQLAPLGARGDSGRTRDFLVSLAGVQLVEASTDDAPAGAPAGAEPRGPVFAVASAPTAATIEWMRRRRDPRDTAVAFLVDADPARVQSLRESDWTVVAVSDRDHPAAAWQLVTEPSGREVPRWR